MGHIVKKPKVLVIDDNQGILFVMQQALKLKGYEAHVLHSFDTVNEIEKISPALIFLDISLPGKDGRTVSQEIKNNKKTQNIPIIVLTGYSNAKELAREAGADDYLSKPFGLTYLWKVIAKHIAL